MVKLNPEFKKMFIDLTRDATFYNLESFLLLKSKYAKLLFPLIAEFKSRGIFSIRDTELYQILNIPKSVINNYQVNVRVLKPAVNELHSLFDRLTYSSKPVKGTDPHKVYTFSFNRIHPNNYATKNQTKPSNNNQESVKKVELSTSQKETINSELPF